MGGGWAAAVRPDPPDPGGGFDPGDLPERLEAVHHRIEAASHDPASVRIVAVTKGFGADAVETAVSAGLTDIGENYAEELRAKARAVDGAAGTAAAESAVTWHFLGAVQRNKVARLAPLVSWWQTVGRIEEGRAIAQRRPGAHVLVQMDVAGLPGRGGCPPERSPTWSARLREEDLDVAGLMAVGRPGAARGGRGPDLPWCRPWPTGWAWPSGPWG